MQLVDGYVCVGDIVWYVSDGIRSRKSYISELKVTEIHDEYINLKRADSYHNTHRIGNNTQAFKRIFTKIENADAKFVELILCKEF